MNTLARHVTSSTSRAARLPGKTCRLRCAALFVRHNTTESNSSTSNASKPNGKQNLDLASIEHFNQHLPNLMEPDILMDLHESHTFAPSRYTPFENKVVIRNDPSMFLALQEQMKKSPNAFGTDEGGRRQREDADSPVHFLHLPANEVMRLYRYPLLSRRVVQQTGKGKIPRHHVVMVIGNQNGLVGIGEGKALEATRAREAAIKEAARNMDYVERFEDRTVWTEMESKFASTRVILRPRPVGFGLRCNPNIYQVLKAAGIKDVSAKVWGSRNPLQVIRALMRMLMPGYTPLGMGNGIGGKGRRLDKGVGLRTKDELERERGRKLVPVRL